MDYSVTPVYLVTHELSFVDKLHVASYFFPLSFVYPSVHIAPEHVAYCVISHP